MFDASYFVPRDTFRFLRALGKREWIDVWRDSTTGRFRVKANWQALETVAKEHLPPSKAVGLATYLKLNPSATMGYEAAATMLSDGPKVFRPTLQQCLASEQVEINLTRLEYQQPFPTMVVEMPNEYCNLRGVPKGLIVRHRPDSLTVICGEILTWNASPKYVSMATVCSDDIPIDQPLGRLYIDDQHIEELDERAKSEKLAERVALNCCLLLTQYATRKQARNPNIQALRKRSHDKSNRERAEGARNTLIGQMDELILDQTIQFHEDEGAAPEVAGHGGWTMRPHWRKGHWRRVVCGVGRTERRLKFIRPVLVHRDRLTADVADTSVTYVG